MKPRSTDPETGPPDSEPVSGGVAGTTHGAYAFGFLIGLGLISAFLLLQLVEAVGSILILVLVALFLAAGLNPAVEFFIRRGLKRGWSVFVVIIVVLVGVALFFVALVPVIVDQVTAIVDQTPGWLDQLQTNPRVQELDERWDVVAKIEEFVTGGEFAGALFGGVVGLGKAVLSFLSSAFIVFVLTLYFVSGLAPLREAMWRLAPATKRPSIKSLGDRVFDDIGAYVAGAFLVALCSGITTLVFLLVIGLGEYAVALASVVAVLGVIPMIGATLGAIVVSAIGFATDVNIGIACVIFYVIYQQLENYVIYPRVMQRSFDLPGWAIVVAALVGAALLGVVGTLMAVPTAAAISMVVKEVWIPRQQRR